MTTCSFLPHSDVDKYFQLSLRDSCWNGHLNRLSAFSLILCTTELLLDFLALFFWNVFFRKISGDDLDPIALRTYRTKPSSRQVTFLAPFGRWPGECYFVKRFPYPSHKFHSSTTDCARTDITTPNAAIARNIRRPKEDECGFRFASPGAAGTASLRD